MERISSRQKLAALLLYAAILAQILVPVYTAAFSFDIVLDPSNLVQNAISAAKDSIIATLTDKNTLKEYILDPLAYIAITSLLNSMTNTIIGWIQGTDSGFVENLENELARNADAVGGQVLNKLAGANLCGNLGAFLRLSLQGPSPSIKQRFQCTVTRIVDNVDKFYEDFSQGGWPAFFEISLRPQNNAYGAYLLALDATIEAQTKRSNSVTQRVLEGKGFLGFKVPREANCEHVSTEDARAIQEFGPLTQQSLKEVAPEPDQEPTYQLCDVEYDTKTPGSLFSDSLKQAVFTGPDQAKYADEIGEAVNVALQQIIFALLQKTIQVSTGGGQGVLGSPELASLNKNITPSQAGFEPTFITSSTDDLAMRLQETQKILDIGAGRIQDIDLQIATIEAEIAKLQAACEEEKKQRLDEECSQQSQIKTLSDSENPGLNTQKSEQMYQLQRANNDLKSLLDIRNGIMVQTDPTIVYNLNTQLGGVSGDAEQVIQTLGGPVTGLAGPDTIFNFIAIIDKARDRAKFATDFIDKKIPLETGTTAKTELTTLKTDIAKLSEELLTLRGQIETSHGTELALKDQCDQDPDACRAACEDAPEAGTPCKTEQINGLKEEILRLTNGATPKITSVVPPTGINQKIYDAYAR